MLLPTHSDNTRSGSRPVRSVSMMSLILRESAGPMSYNGARGVVN